MFNTSFLKKPLWWMGCLMAGIANSIYADYSLKGCLTYLGILLGGIFVGMALNDSRGRS